MAESQAPNVNSWLEEELQQQYLSDRRTVDASWSEVFEGNGHASDAAPAAPAAAVTTPAPVRQAVEHHATVAVPLSEGDQLVPLRGPALRIAENMTASLSMPVATSQRSMPVKVIDENRRLINQYRALAGANKVSYTHLVAWAIVRALEKVPALNQAFSDSGDESFRVLRKHVNLGIAVDVAGKEGARSLKVPSIKDAQAMNFAQFCAAYDDLISRARTNKLTVDDLTGATISLTNPGTVGTVGAIPRLMPGQGAIIATGAIDYPPEYRGVPEETRSSLGLSKVMTVTSTYDHRVIQGAESGMFLGALQALLEGDGEFYTKIFADLAIPLQPWRWEMDPAPAPAVNADPVKQAAVSRLIQTWRERGHLLAQLDPLGSARTPQPDLEPTAHGLTIWDLDRTFYAGHPGHAGSFGITTLRTLLDQLRETYAGTMGVQYMHIENPEERRWLEERLESTAWQRALPAEVRRRVLETIVGAEDFDVFLDTRFKGHKRFSLEGGEAMMAMIVELLERAAAAGADECVIGMAHRGRLTVLANVVGKSMLQFFSDFEGDMDPDSIEGSGDVKYHLGASGVFHTASGREIKVAVAPNPSHLEAVNPVVEGIVRPKQDRLGDKLRQRVLPLIIHGDAAMAGQGVVAETLNLSRLPGYETGGTVHIVVNNQIGFTANPQEGRSSTYCTDVALMLQGPVFHVNGDDPEACVRAIQLAYEYRQKFHNDSIVDMVCYRKHGHNENDDPSYTQPLLYRKIRAQKPVATLYADRLKQEGLVTADEVARWRESNKLRLREIYDQAQLQKEQFGLQEMSAMPAGSLPEDHSPTAVEASVLEQIVAGVTSFPADFHLHPKLAGGVQKRRDSWRSARWCWRARRCGSRGKTAAEGRSANGTPCFTIPRMGTLMFRCNIWRRGRSDSRCTTAR
jgi:2-oxoglutarate dehydrogenase E1 component